MKKLFVMAALCLMGMTAQAQQNLSWGQGPQVASPDVHADNTVTFNLIALVVILTTCLVWWIL